MNQTATNATAALLIAADAAARSIEAFAAEHSTTYAAAQTFYGVEVEALVKDKWVRLRELKAGAEVEAVRLFDCDGERGRECRTIEEVEAERVQWIDLLKRD